MAVTPPDLRARAKALPSADRARLLRRIGGVARIDEAERREEVLLMLAAEIAALEERIARRRSLRPTGLTYPEELPIAERRAELLTTIREHQVVIVAGETGSGKSTQLPKLCLELGRGIDGMIGHTQPRRIAARSIAERVAEEVGTPLGGLVGYTVRFSDQVGEDTLVKVMTDGILLAEIHHDRLLRRYDTIILDEAHERSLNIDFLLGYLKSILPKRPDLKLIVTSATIDTARFSAHFDDAPVVEVSGRTYPVEMRYRPLDDPGAAEPRDQTQGICDAVAELAAEAPGDVLVFCSGEREIRDAADAIRDMNLRHTEVLPLYARLPAAEQHRIFRAHTGRRIVVSTNVAETSLTVPGVRYVVDAGTARISRFSRRTKVQRLPIEPVSQASANQRAGRCGRLGPGVCIRLYAEDDFDSRPEFTEPEVLRTNLASVILQMAALDLGSVESFPFLDPPDSKAIRDGVALLSELGAIDPAGEGTNRWLTPTGRKLAKFPLDPRLARMVIEADRDGCLREVLIIAAALSIQDPRERPKEHEAHADQLHARFRDQDSDFVSWLHLWKYLHSERRGRSSSQFRRMCRDEFLNYRRVREWQDVHAQLREASADVGFRPNRKPASPDVVHRALLSGLLSQVGKKDPDGYEYRGARGIRFSLSPGSVLFKSAPEWVMAAELVETSRLWARSVAPVPIDWVEQAGAHLLKRSHSDPWWDADQGAAVATETVTLYGIPLVTDRLVQFARIDSVQARELFIRHALVAGEWETYHDFEPRNRQQIDRVLEIEAKERRTDLLVDDEALVRFFDSRIPDDIATVRHFDRWWRDAKRDHPDLLDLSPDDLIDPAARPPDGAAYPDTWHHGDLDISLEYEFDPASPSDGVTIDVPLRGLDRVNPAVFEWNVPGVREELVTAMIRTLPKPIRRRFLPIPETARDVLTEIGPASGPLRESLRRALVRKGGVAIAPDAFDVAELPTHLRPTFRILDGDGRVVAEGDDLSALKTTLRDDARATLREERHHLERAGVTQWDIGDLPRVVETGDEGHRVRAYPALVDEGDSVAVRLLATPQEQVEAMQAGTRRLLLLTLPSPERLLRPLLTTEAKLALHDGPYGNAAEWVDDCLNCAVGEVLVDAGGPAWDGTRFDELRTRVRDELADRVTTVGLESLAVLAALGDVGRSMDNADRYPEVEADVVAQVNRLVYPGFITGVGAGRLGDLRRYLLAVAHRLERLPEEPERDRARMVRVRRLEEEFERLADLLPSSPELGRVAWMLEELRVSLFAQPLGTSGKVSEKRIERALADLIG